MAFNQRVINGVTILQSSLIPMRHGFTTRLGGVSEGALASMNLGEHRGDEPWRVKENYARVAEAIGFDADKLVFTSQVHGTVVRYAAPEDSRSPYTTIIKYECDGLYTDTTDLPILCFTADCVPVLLCDPIAGAAAAVHCGWRSSVQDILGVAVGKLASLGSKPEDIRAAIGPAIGACCFEVGEDVPESMRQWLGEAAETFIVPKPDTPGKFLVDLRGANRHRLITLGLLSENIDVSSQCTMCAPDKFWSHRATKGVRGNMAAIIIP